MRAGFRGALERGLEERTATLGAAGIEISLRFAGTAMADATLPALAPLTTRGGGESAFVIELWDSASAGVPPPRSPWGPEAAGRLGAVKGYNEGPARTVVDHASRTITVCDLASGYAVVWAHSAAELPGWWQAMPLRRLLGWLLAGPNRHVVHAGAVSVGGRGVLLAGSGGAGKSTLSLTCVEAGMDYVGDDYVLLSSQPCAEAHALYGTAKLDERSLSSVSGLSDEARRQRPSLTDYDKRILDLSVLRPSRLVRSTSVKAIIAPRIADRRQSAMNPISKGAALRALAPSTLFQASDGGPAALRVLSDVVQAVPCYELLLGGDPRQPPELLRSVAAAEP